jgi:putative transposase
MAERVSPVRGSSPARRCRLPPKGAPRLDGGKRIRGRKRHIGGNVLGVLLVVVVHAAGLQNCDGAQQVLRALVPRFAGLELLGADAGSAGKHGAWMAPGLPRTVVMVQRPRDTHGLQVLRWRGSVARPFGWLKRSRRLRKDFEAWPKTTETWLRNAVSSVMVRRLATRM